MQIVDGLDFIYSVLSLQSSMSQHHRVVNKQGEMDADVNQDWRGQGKLPPTKINIWRAKYLEQCETYSVGHSRIG